MEYPSVRFLPGCRWEELGIFHQSAPLIPEFVSNDCRLRSFDLWPIGLSQKCKEMADAGFVYSGKSDCVKCFFCGGVLFAWVPGDDPWVEHAKWFPFCHHVVFSKGKSFVFEVHRKKMLPLSSVVLNARVEMLMSCVFAVSAVRFGLKVCDVRDAVVMQVEQFGKGFFDLDSLVNAGCQVARDRMFLEDLKRFVVFV